MKRSQIPLSVAMPVLLLAGCMSGDPSARTDYRDSTFDTVAPGFQERRAQLRRAHPNATEEAIRAHGSGLYRRQKRESRRAAEVKEEQRAFEKKLAEALQEK